MTEKLKKISNEILYILLALPAMFLLVNKYPYLLVGSVILSVIIGLGFFIRKRAITNLHSELAAILLIIFTYLVLSYFVTGQGIRNFFSYSFLRNDGNFFFCYILFFVFSLASLDYEKLAKYFFSFTFFIFTVFSTVGIVEYFLGGKLFLVRIEPNGGKMFFALNSAHNATGSIYAIVCISLMVFFLKSKKIKTKFFYLALLLINIVALFLTKSRSGYLGFAAAIVFVIWFHFKSIKKFFITIGILIAAALPILFLTDSIKRLLQVRAAESFTTVVRLFIWEKAWYLFSQSPMFGIGFGRFNDIFNIDKGLFDLGRLKGIPGVVELYMKSNFYYDAAHAHNSYLQFLTETGIIGFILLMVFWILAMIKILNMYQRSSDDFSNKVLLSAFGSIVALFVLAFFENYMSATTVMIPVSMLTSIAIGLYWKKNLDIVQVNLVCET